MEPNSWHIKYLLVKFGDWVYHEERFVPTLAVQSISWGIHRVALNGRSFIGKSDIPLQPEFLHGNKRRMQYSVTACRRSRHKGRFLKAATQRDPRNDIFAHLAFKDSRGFAHLLTA